MVRFHPDKHYYESLDLFNPIKWYSASHLAGYFKKPFDDKMAEKCSNKKDSKWYGIPPEEISAIWKNENIRSTTLGTWYHEKEEAKLLGLDTLQYKNCELPIIKPVWENGWKIAPDQKLKDGIYPELLVYLLSVGACGQFDRVNICNGVVDVDDHKSNKDLKKPAYVNRSGVVERMLPPLLHLDNNKLNEYSIQLSIGMYIILRHNPLFKAGDLTLNYVMFEIESEDRFGYPIMRLDANKEPIVKDVEQIKLPYMKREVELIFEYLKSLRK